MRHAGVPFRSNPSGLARPGNLRAKRLTVRFTRDLDSAAVADPESDQHDPNNETRRGPTTLIPWPSPYVVFSCFIHHTLGNAAAAAVYQSSARRLCSPMACRRSSKARAYPFGVKASTHVSRSSLKMRSSPRPPMIQSSHRCKPSRQRMRAQPSGCTPAFYHALQDGNRTGEPVPRCARGNR